MSLKRFVEQLPIADPKEVKIELDDKRNALKVFWRGRVYFNVLPKKPFPFTRKYFIILETKGGEEVLYLKDYRQLDDKSRAALEEMINRTYFIPTITRIKNLVYKGGTYRWDVETDRGPIEFETHGGRNILKVSDDEIVIFDVNKNIYRIDVKKLDKKSLFHLYFVL